ncbi:hypothetical protein F4825DRAFT_425655, partial [Nemania diffusa]
MNMLLLLFSFTLGLALYSVTRLHLGRHLQVPVGLVDLTTATLQSTEEALQKYMTCYPVPNLRLFIRSRTEPCRRKRLPVMVHSSDEFPKKTVVTNCRTICTYPTSVARLHCTDN